MVPSWMTAVNAAPGILPAHEGRHDPQVRGARDGQELGQPLDDAEDDGLERVHGGRTVARRACEFSDEREPTERGPKRQRGGMSTGTIESRSPQDQSDVVVAPRPRIARRWRRPSSARAGAQKEWSRNAVARADALSAAAEALDAAKDEVVDLMVREVGKPLTESVMEHGRAVRILRYQAQSALDPDGDTYPRRRPPTRARCCSAAAARAASPA